MQLPRKTFFKGAVEFLQVTDRSSLADNDDTLKKILDDSQVQRKHETREKESKLLDYINQGLLPAKTIKKPRKIDIDKITSALKSQSRVQFSSFGTPIETELSKISNEAPKKGQDLLSQFLSQRQKNLQSTSTSPKGSNLRHVQNTDASPSRKDIEPNPFIKISSNINNTCDLITDEFIQIGQLDQLPNTSQQTVRNHTRSIDSGRSEGMDHSMMLHQQR